MRIDGVGGGKVLGWGEEDKGKSGNAEGAKEEREGRGVRRGWLEVGGVVRVSGESGRASLDTPPWREFRVEAYGDSCGRRGWGTRICRGVNWRDEIVFVCDGWFVGGGGLCGGRAGFGYGVGRGCEEADDVCGFAGDEEGE